MVAEAGHHASRVYIDQDGAFHVNGGAIFDDNEVDISAALNELGTNNRAIAGTLAVTGITTLASELDMTDGGTVTQITDDSTGVSLNKVTGEIVTVGLVLAAGVDTSFIFTNSVIEQHSCVLVWGKVYGGSSDGIIQVTVEEVADGTCVINIKNGGAVTMDAPATIGFLVIGGAVT